MKFKEFMVKADAAADYYWRLRGPLRYTEEFFLMILAIVGWASFVNIEVEDYLLENLLVSLTFPYFMWRMFLVSTLARKQKVVQ